MILVIDTIESTFFISKLVNFTNTIVTDMLFVNIAAEITLDYFMFCKFD